MRRFDKNHNIKKANILAEQRYLSSKELIEEERIDMGEFFGDTTSNVDTLLKMFSKYQPENGWVMTVGYVNNANLSVTIKNENMPELENIARRLGNQPFIDMVDSPEWLQAKEKGGNTKNPFAAQKPKGGDAIPAKVYTTKKFMVQWGNVGSKPNKDAALKAIYDKHGIEWEEGKIPTDDKRGSGWESIPSTPFQQNQNTGTKRLAYYANQATSKGMGETKYFLNFKGDITELNKEEVSYLYSLSPKDLTTKTGIPDRLAHLPIEAAQEIKQMEDGFQFKNLDLSKIMYINCSMKINGETKKFTYVNLNATPAGLNPGDFKEFIEASLR